MLRQQMQGIDAAELRRRSAVACERLMATAVFDRAAALMLFLPLAHEVDAQPIAVRAWQLAKTVTVPRVGYEQRHMIPIEIRSVGEPMDTDRLGVRTPAAGRPFPPELLDLIVVPGLGFDELGRRLGRGGGFYDRFLSTSGFVGLTCGLGLDEQVIDRVPAAAHDVSLDMLVTDERTLSFDGLPRHDRTKSRR